MKKLALVAASALIMFSANPSFAAVEQYVLDNPHTQILFGVEHMGLSTSYGKFLDYAGNIKFDRDNPANSQVDVVIKAASLTLGQDKWDAHVKNADFLDVEKFPEINFKSTKVEVTGEKTGTITGDLTLHGVTKPVVLDVVFNKAGAKPMGGKYAAGFSAKAKIKRSDFGINYGIPMIGDDVQITLEVEADRDMPATDAEKAAAGVK